MKSKYFKNAHSCDLDMSPVIYRLQPLREYQSPWKFFPRIQKTSRSTIQNSEETSIVDMSKRRLRLELPKIEAETLDHSNNSMISLEKKSFKKSLKSLRSYIIPVRDKSIKNFIESRYVPQKRYLTPLKDL